MVELKLFPGWQYTDKDNTYKVWILMEPVEKLYPKTIVVTTPNELIQTTSYERELVKVKLRNFLKEFPYARPLLQDVVAGGDPLFAQVIASSVRVDFIPPDDVDQWKRFIIEHGLA